MAIHSPGHQGPPAPRAVATVSVCLRRRPSQADKTIGATGHNRNGITHLESQTQSRSSARTSGNAADATHLAPVGFRNGGRDRRPFGPALSRYAGNLYG